MSRTVGRIVRAPAACLCLFGAASALAAGADHLRYFKIRDPHQTLWIAMVALAIGAIFTVIVRGDFEARCLALGRLIQRIAR
jgi:hypothetical protein